ncbi:MAG: hypothetical protein JSR37_03795 [Verrucomicrobia bacterium]|nr:hypothetical protein [Verrucomicrobiota bacterium]MBS0637359.1 hypothetical protein [Verrucomicrobiota bacterium]
MHDDEIKKLLNDLKSGECEETPQPIRTKRHRSAYPILLILICLTLAPSGYMLVNGTDDEQETEVAAVPPPPGREELAASWAREIVSLDPDEGQSVHLLWDMLRRRKEDLENISLELSTLLNDNARFRQDFYGQAATVLLSRYQALDARHSVEIANQINTIYKEVRGDPELTIAYAEMLGELGAESYSTHQIQIAKEILHQENLCQRALSGVEKSNTLSDLEYNIELAGHVIQQAQENGIMQTFHSDGEYELTLVQKCKDALDKLLVQDNCPSFTAETRALIQRVLSRAGAPDSDVTYYLKKFDSLIKPVEPHKAIAKN